MGIVQFIILLAFILLYVAIVGALIARLAKRSAGDYFNRAQRRNGEVQLGG